MKNVSDLDFTSAQLLEQVEIWEAKKTRTGKYSISSPVLLAKKRTKPSIEKTSLRGSIGKKRHSHKSRLSPKEQRPKKEDKDAKLRPKDDKV